MAAAAGTQAKAGEALKWSLGLINCKGKYLTAENYNNGIVASANNMKKNQIFFLEANASGTTVAIRTCLNRYLSVSRDGDFPADHDGAPGDEQQFEIEPQEDGRWAFKSKPYGWYVTGVQDPKGRHAGLSCFRAELDETHLWNVHLAMHPQICMKSTMRKAFVHLVDDSEPNQLCANEIIPWGDDATVTLGFVPASGSTQSSYTVQSCDGRYLADNGALTDSLGPANLFMLHFKGNQVAFKSRNNGKYLTGLGSTGALKCTKTAITKDETFIFEDSFPQIKMTAKNGKKVSIKSGVEIAANQTTSNDEECFQVEPTTNAAGKVAWTIKCCSDKFWELNDGATVSATAVSAEAAGAGGLFEIEWHGPQIAIKASNGKYLTQMMNSYVQAKADDASDEATRFTYEIINRPRLVLRGEYGFIGTLPSGLLECNKSAPEAYTMNIIKGMAQLQHANGKYWKVGSNGVTATGGEPEQYTLELYPDSKLAIKFEGRYFHGAQNGALTASAASIDNKCLFEY